MGSEQRQSMFENSHGFQINGGYFSIADRVINNYNDPLRDLWDAIKDVGASHNSETRYPPPKCHPDTRQHILEILHRWIYDPSWADRVFWLYGPAGTGKSAIAQTIAETGQREGFLVSSFFFSRGDPKRNNARPLFLTIAHALATSIPELRLPIEEALRGNPTILQASLEEQYEKLIVEPCKVLTELNRFPWVVIIDGLDECNGSREQQRILSILATIFSEHIRIRFLVCSRPEPPIREVFDTDVFRPYLRRVALSEILRPSRDISTFLTSEFQRIRSDSAYQHIPFPSSWPDPGIIDELVQKASGQFIYATTVIKFIDDEYSNPCTQLEIILHPGTRSVLDLESDSPYHDLDILYRQILLSNPHRIHSKLQKVIRAVVLMPMLRRTTVITPPTPSFVEAFLMLQEGEVISTLRGMHSVLDIGGPYDTIRIPHASFSDFLRDPTRSGDFFLGDERTWNTFVTAHFLRAIDHYSRICDGDGNGLSYEQDHLFEYAWVFWGYYCFGSNLDVETLDALRNVDFTKKLGIHIRNYLHRISNRGQSDNTGIRYFFIGSERLRRRLQMEPNVPADIIRRFSDPSHCLCIKVSQSDIPDAVLHQVLDAAALELGCILLRSDSVFGPLIPFEMPRLGALHDTYPTIPDFFHSDRFQLVSVGDGCGCAQKNASSNHLTFPCSQSSLDGGIYHLELDLAIKKLIPTQLFQFTPIFDD
ncbi:nwd2 [Moniliophthora roreri MCA 2997]|uniref:Nwd2 n=2 Tax=Moniliophthora roreri TaxID=221103 RepID=V2Y150_MONRO|nr:nwd2 [Moniliophthora roreri MCA 2997]KAI3615098.1 nwd2 [Moniliophthora roreri]